MILLQTVSFAHAQDTAAVIFLNRDQSGYDFGPIPAGDKPQLEIPIKNIGNTIVTIKSVNSDDGNIKFRVSKNVIKPGKTSYIFATFDPRDPSARGSFRSGVTVSFVGISSVSSFEIRGAQVPDTGAPLERQPKHKTTHKSPKAASRNSQDGNN